MSMHNPESCQLPINVTLFQIWNPIPTLQFTGLQVILNAFNIENIPMNIYHLHKFAVAIYKFFPLIITMHHWSSTVLYMNKNVFELKKSVQDWWSYRTFATE